ncbi:hypothetical protein AZSI13_10190, partial [Azospira sp. I13]
MPPSAAAWPATTPSPIRTGPSPSPPAPS